jgi:hypothetical protein
VIAITASNQNVVAPTMTAIRDSLLLRGRPMRTHPTLTIAACCLALAGCDGLLSGPGGRDQPGPAGDPGRVTLHRLNRAEYNNTVRDLLGTARRPADDFPTDDYAHGFDNIADVLSISPMHAELYQRAAEALAREVMAPPGGEIRRGEAEALGGSVGSASGGAWVLTSNGTVAMPVELPTDGSYTVAIAAGARQGGPDVARMEIRIDGVAVATVEVAAAAASPARYEVTAALTAGSHTVAAAFINDYYNPDAGEDRNLHVDWIEVAGPVGGVNPARDRLMVCQPDPAAPEGCVADIARAFARRAWRRPVSDAEVDALVGLLATAAAQGDGVDRGLELIVEAVLSSPYFLFRFEIDPEPTSLEPRPLDDHELASRLSYFLWSSMPDDELFALADAGSLRQPDELALQVERMLADPKAAALVDNFAGQWINLRALDDHEPDYALFPAYDPALRDDMIEETRRFFRQILESGRPFGELLTADWTYLSPRLAEHYGVPHPGGDGFVRVQLEGPRRGLFGHGSVLTATSYPTRTSPVKRGKWVLEQLLCSAPPPPPPGVEGLDGQVDATGSIRDRMEQHRTNPVCASCHESMDPIGFALEHFDGVGAWRETDGEFAIDATGELPGGARFDGAAELAAVLADDPRFRRCLGEKLLTYATGRGLEAFDRRTLDRLSHDLADAGDRLTDLVLLVALSDPFLYRRGEPAGGAR